MTKNELVQENHRLRAELDAVRLDAMQRADELRAEIASLTARNARLTKGLEHYAANETWDDGGFGRNAYLYMPDRDGSFVAREALKGGEDEIK